LTIFVNKRFHVIAKNEMFFAQSGTEFSEETIFVMARFLHRKQRGREREREREREGVIEKERERGGWGNLQLLLLCTFFIFFF
jgi:hypothetical protein